MSQMKQMERSAPRICPLVEDVGNRRLLEEFLETHKRFELVPEDGSVAELDFDVAILDGGALKAHATELERAKTAAKPVLLPYLLLVPQTESDLIAIDEGKLVDSVLTRTIDEIVTLPIERSELHWRIQALLRLRAQSIEAVEQGERHRSLFENMQDAIVVSDADGRVTEVNRAFVDLFGTGKQLLEGRHVREFFEDESILDSLLARFEREPSKVKFTETIALVGPEGEPFPADVTISRLKAEDGTTTGYIGGIRDASERQARIERIERLAEYRRVASAVNHVLVGAGADAEILPKVATTIASSNRFGCTFLALAEGGEIGFVCEAGSELTDEQVEAIHTKAYFESVAEAGTVEMADVTEPPHDQHEEETAPHSGIAIAIQYDDRQYGVMTVHFPPGQSPSPEEVTLLEELAGDIALSLHDRELERELSTFEEIVQRIDDPIMLQDLDGAFLVVNNALAEYAGMDRAELIGADETAFMDAESAATIRQEKERVIETGTPNTYEVEPTLPTRGNRVFQTTRFPHYDESGEIDGTVAICRDVSSISERNQHLRVLSRILRHNLNNEMNVILGHAESVGAESPRDREMAASRIKEAGERLVELANKERRLVDLLGEPESPDRFDVSQLLKRTVAATEAAYPSADIELRCQDDLWASVTPSFGEAVFELIENAIIHAGTEATRVEIEGGVDESTVRITVADTGPGIPAAERKVLAGNSISPLQHGSGVGLWLVNHIVRQSDGKLSITDRDPVGSVVEICVPLAS